MVFGKSGIDEWISTALLSGAHRDDGETRGGGSPRLLIGPACSARPPWAFVPVPQPLVAPPHVEWYLLLSRMSMERIYEKVSGAAAVLPTTRCFRRFLDLQLLDFDIADDKSFISKKLTPDEIAAVRNERALLLRMCTIASTKEEANTPYLYQLSTGAAAAAAIAARREEYRAASSHGPYEGVKASDGHH
jgi:hypothetical protein